MAPHTRAMIAAATFAYFSGKKVAGMHDHSLGKDLRIAAECRGDRMQGYDGDRSAGFGGALPEIFDTGTNSFVSVEIEGATAKGFDHLTSTAFTAEVSDRRVQVYDYGQAAWFTFDVQVAEAARG